MNGAFAEPCPSCGKMLGADTDITLDDGTGNPEVAGPGDVSICMYCTAFLTFGADMRRSLLTTEQIGELPHETVQQLSKARRVIKEMT